MLGKRERPGTALPAEVAMGESGALGGLCKARVPGTGKVGARPVFQPANLGNKPAGGKGRERAGSSGAAAANEGILAAGAISRKENKHKPVWAGWNGWLCFALPHTLVTLLEPNTCGVVWSQKREGLHPERFTPRAPGARFWGLQLSAGHPGPDLMAPCRWDQA